MSRASIYTGPPPHWTELTEEQLHGLSLFLRSGSDGIAGGEVCFVRAWFDAMASFSIGCLSIDRKEIEAVCDTLKHVVEFGELALAATAASQLAWIGRDQSWLVAIAVVWGRNPEQALASRRWRYPCSDGVLVSKSRVDVADELSVAVGAAGASLADKLLESVPLTETESEALVTVVRDVEISFEYLTLLL